MIATDQEKGASAQLTIYSYWSRSMSALLFGSHLNILLLCTPFAFVAKWSSWGDGWVFILSLLSIAPFAERLSFVTEQLAMHTSETLGGLLNATFGNVTELIVSLFALREGLLRIVQVRSRDQFARRRASLKSSPIGSRCVHVIFACVITTPAFIPQSSSIAHTSLVLSCSREEVQVINTCCSFFITSFSLSVL